MQVGISNESPLPKYDDNTMFGPQIETSADIIQTSSKYAQPQTGRTDQHNIVSEIPFLDDPLPPPPTPPNITTNATITPIMSYVSEIPAHNFSATTTCEEPKYARVEIKNKRNSKQIYNGNSSSHEIPLEGTSNT